MIKLSSYKKIVNKILKNKIIRMNFIKRKKIKLMNTKNVFKVYYFKNKF